MMLVSIMHLNSELLERICRICVDIGGSRLRVRISNVSQKEQFVVNPNISAKSTQELVDSLTSIHKALGKIVPKYEICGAALAVAGPIKNGTVILTNPIK